MATSLWDWYFNCQNGLQILNSFSLEPTLFLGHVDLNYKVDDTDDENKAYRDLKIQHPTTNMAGKYSCKVSTFEDEGFVEQQLNIFGNLIRISCST